MPVSAADLKIEELRLRYLGLIARADVFPTRANWQFIASHKMRGLGHGLYLKYLTALTIDDNDREPLHDIAVEEFPKYLRCIDRKEAVDVIYSDLVTAPEATLEIIREQNLFDAESLSNMLDEGELTKVMYLLDVYQPSYEDYDLGPMKTLLMKLDSLPETGGVRQVDGLFGSSMKYICPAGHKNPSDTEYCTHSGCGLDAKGLTQSDHAKIELFRNRIKALEGLIKAGLI